jgi:glycine/D-amino acid oxidase-like deaminating enzyme
VGLFLFPAELGEALAARIMGAMAVSIAVLGGGIMGVRTAWALARRQRGPVWLLEKRELAAGSSGRSGAVLRQHYCDPELAAMARDSLVEYANLEARTGQAIGFQRCGVLTVAGPRTPEMLERVRANVRMQQGLGIDTRLVDAREIRRLVAGIEVDDATIAAFEPGGGFCDPRRAVAAFAELARAAGAQLQIGRSALRLRIEAGRVRAVETDAGALEVDLVVLAAGPWTQRLLQSSGLSLPLEVVRPRQHFVDCGFQLGEAPIDVEARAEHPVLLDLELGYYTRCEPARNRTRIGALGHDGDDPVPDPDHFDEHVEASFAHWARAKLEQRLPSYRTRADQTPEAALYTLTPDSQPILGRLAGVEGLLIAAGFSGHGFKLAPSVGEGLAQQAFKEPLSAFNENFFSAERFRNGAGAKPSAFGL